MDRSLVDRLEALLREEGFETSQDYAGTHAVTISGRKGDVRAVVHVSEREARSFHAVRLEEMPHPAAVRMKAGLPPGVRAAVSGPGVIGVGGAGGERQARSGQARAD